MRRSLILAAFVLMPASLLGAERTHDIVPQDYFSLAAVTEIAASPDGHRAAFCLATWDKADNGRKTDLWLVDTNGKSPPRRLTFDRANDRHPKWSRTGDAIYFLGNRKRGSDAKTPYDGKSQVWSIRLDEGAEPRAVTRVDGGVAAFDIAPNAGAIYYSVESPATDSDDFAKLRAKHPAEYGHGSRKVSEIHRLDLASWRSEKLIAENRYVREFTVTRDGKRIAMVSAIDDTIIKSEGESRVDIWEQGAPASRGKVTTPPTDVYRKSAASPWAWLEDLAWNPTGTRFAFCAIFDAHPAEVIIGESTAAGWSMKRMKRNHGRENTPEYHVRGYGSPIWWSGPDLLVCLHEASGCVGWFTCHAQTQTASSLGKPRTNETPTVIPMIHAVSGPVWLWSEKNRFAELVNASNAEMKPLTDLNPHTKTWKLPTVEHITWKAPDGTEVGGVLELPYGYKKGDKLPLVVAIHGGPTTSTKADLSFDPHNGRLYFAAAGYAVLCPNYRGSTGYGDKFVTDLIGRENDIEVKDILAGIQHLIKEGIADPERVGVMGWSNGGYLTNCLITLKDSPVKFKAASSGAGILDTVAEWGFNDEPAYAMVFKRGLPWEQPDIYRKTSPIYGLGNVTTPTLIHVGANDERCPPGHSRSLYRALREYRHVPTELVAYPGEPHGLSKMSHRQAKMEWDLAWFDKYLKAKKK